MLKTKFIPYIMLVYEKPYDALGQLRRENNASTNTTSAWNYDTLGNIESVITYDYTTGDLGNLETGIDYQYTDDGKSGWSRLLTTLVYKTYTYDAEGNRTTTVNDTKTITYDNIGNPVNYLGANLTWRGRQLKKYVDGSTTVSYLYDANGLRGSKTVNGVKSTYTYVGDKLVYESRSDGKEFYFFYDSYNNLTAIRYISGSTDNYYYVTTNLQGDVLGIYTGGGVLLASYEYDAWGNCTVTSHNANFTIGEDNPIRYRGYYYDSETGLYYLQSRYYDAEIGRFINSDNITDSGSGILGYNTFIYCANNPVNGADPSGHNFFKKLGKHLWSNFKATISLFSLPFKHTNVEIGVGTGIGGGIEFSGTGGVLGGELRASSTTSIEYKEGAFENKSTTSIAAGISILGIVDKTYEKGVSHSLYDTNCTCTYGDIFNRHTCPANEPFSSFDTTYGFSASLYLGLGGSFSIGVDLIKIKEEGEAILDECEPFYKSFNIF